MAHPSHRLTIGQAMGVVAGLAVLWALATTPNMAAFLVRALLPLALLILGPIVVLQHLMDGAVGARCPHCGDANMERRIVSSFGARFYRCPACGVRCKRGTLGGWEDASGPEHDAKYRRKPGDDPWSAPPDLGDEDLIYSKTHGNLVRSKRQRRPDNPNGPGLE